LRQRPEERKVAPLILDVIDVHRSMQSQSKLRIAYYKKCGYKILDGDKDVSEVKEKEKESREYGFIDD
jgi:hypothetical protein